MPFFTVKFAILAVHLLLILSGVGVCGGPKFSRVISKYIASQVFRKRAHIAWLDFSLLADNTIFSIMVLKMNIALFVGGGGVLVEVDVFGFLYLSLRKK